MPRVRRHRKQRHAGYTEAHIRHLLTGHDFFGDGFGRADSGSFDADAMRQGWELLRGELLPAWISEHPRSRPSAWWLFDAPSRRQRTDGKPHPFDSPERIAKVDVWRAKYPDAASAANTMSFGKPVCLLALDDYDAVYESEADYLARCGLLTETERVAS